MSSQTYPTYKCALVLGERPFDIISRYTSTLYLVDHGPLDTIFKKVGIEPTPRNIPTAIQYHLGMQQPPWLVFGEPEWFADPQRARDTISRLMNMGDCSPDGYLVMKEGEMQLLVPSTKTKNVRLFGDVTQGGVFKDFLITKEGSVETALVEDIDWEAMGERSLAAEGGMEEYHRIMERVAGEEKILDHLPVQYRDQQLYASYHEWIGSLPWYLIYGDEYYSFEDMYVGEDGWDPDNVPCEYLEQWAALIHDFTQEVPQGTKATVYEVS